jgi:hypothetical protein
MPLNTDYVTPLQREALREALAAPTHSLVRTPDGFMAAHRRANAESAPKFTRRLINNLDHDGLVHVDDPDCPSEVTLNTHGLKLAEQLRAADQAKAGAR